MSNPANGSTRVILESIDAMMRAQSNVFRELSTCLAETAANPEQRDNHVARMASGIGKQLHLMTEINSELMAKAIQGEPEAERVMPAATTVVATPSAPSETTTAATAPVKAASAKPAPSKAATAKTVRAKAAKNVKASAPKVDAQAPVAAPAPTPAPAPATAAAPAKLASVKAAALAKAAPAKTAPAKAGARKAPGRPSKSGAIKAREIAAAAVQRKRAGGIDPAQMTDIQKRAHEAAMRAANAVSSASTATAPAPVSAPAPVVAKKASAVVPTAKGVVPAVSVKGPRKTLTAKPAAPAPAAPDAPATVASGAEDSFENTVI